MGVATFNTAPFPLPVSFQPKYSISQMDHFFSLQHQTEHVKSFKKTPTFFNHFSLLCSHINRKSFYNVFHRFFPSFIFNQKNFSFDVINAGKQKIITNKRKLISSNLNHKDDRSFFLFFALIL